MRKMPSELSTKLQDALSDIERTTELWCSLGKNTRNKAFV